MTAVPRALSRGTPLSRLQAPAPNQSSGSGRIPTHADFGHWRPYCCGGAEHGELVGAVGTGLGMVDDEHRVVSSADTELFSVEPDRADLQVVDGQARAAARSDVVARPETAEKGAGDGQLPDEVDEPEVVGGRTDRLAEPGDQRLGGALPVAEEGLLSRSRNTSRRWLPPVCRRGESAVASEFAASTSR